MLWSHLTLEPTQGKRFNCVEWDFQDHSNREAGVLISARELEEQNRNMPALNKPFDGANSEDATVWQRGV